MKGLGLAAFLVCMGMQAQAAGDILKSMGPLLARDGNDAGVFRGGVVYGNYCVTCHGINADGNGRAARLYAPRPANLRASDKNDEYILMIVRMGGAAVGRSEFMPPWGAELTEEQMKDVTAYLRAINSASQR